MLSSTVQDSSLAALFPAIDKLREIIKPDDLTSWDRVWQAKITPWDVGHIQPPLRGIIESGTIDFPRTGRALVPGCGSGLDAIYIASALGLETTGIDIAETAFSKAQEALKSAENPELNVNFKLGNFFNLTASSDEEKFDLVYDYTFFVAIPPPMRVDWGRQMNALIKPGGFLITLVFPIDSPTDLGPPYFVRVEHYEKVLGEGFVKLVDKVPEVVDDRHVGKDRIVVYQRV